MVKRTFTLPENISQTLDQTIPNQQRSRFIATLLSDTFKKRQRSELIHALDAIEPWNDVDESAVELIRRVRSRHSGSSVN